MSDDRIPPPPGTYVLFAIDAPATVDYYCEGDVDETARAALSQFSGSGAYCGVILEENQQTRREMNEQMEKKDKHCSMKLSPLQQGLFRPSKGEWNDLVLPDMCLPVAPEKKHPLGRLSLDPAPPLPWQGSYYHATAQCIHVRIPLQEDIDYSGRSVLNTDHHIQLDINETNVRNRLWEIYRSARDAVPVDEPCDEKSVHTDTLHEDESITANNLELDATNEAEDNEYRYNDFIERFPGEQEWDDDAGPPELSGDHTFTPVVTAEFFLETNKPPPDFHLFYEECDILEQIVWSAVVRARARAKARLLVAATMAGASHDDQDALSVCKSETQDKEPSKDNDAAASSLKASRSRFRRIGQGISRFTKKLVPRRPIQHLLSKIRTCTIPCYS
ncbi:hypothetical protein C8J56DRAFT_1024967 [Mycena floridula]|nr:hypothetical protein C8J56DRAFT_1024967 [Mycena floridula]